MHSFLRSADKAAKASQAMYDLSKLAPNIVDVGEGDADPTKRRASVKLEFYGPDSHAKATEASNAIRAILGR